MKTETLNNWSTDKMRRLRYMQSIKVTMAYLQKNKQQLSPEELWHQYELLEKLIIQVDQIDNPEHYESKHLCLTNRTQRAG